MIERIGYCFSYIVTLCHSPESLIRAEVEWTETGIVQQVEIGREIKINGQGYYRLRLWKEKNND